MNVCGDKVIFAHHISGVQPPKEQDTGSGRNSSQRGGTCVRVCWYVCMCVCVGVYVCWVHMGHLLSCDVT